MSQGKLAAGETGLEIAIIGMAGKFPGADSVAEFWSNLQNGTNQSFLYRMRI